MGTENRERTLQPHEKPIWRDTFKEAIKYTSVEGATRNAWKAVDAWNAARAFTELAEQPKIDVDKATSYCDVFKVLRSWLRKSSMSVEPNLNVSRLCSAVVAFDEGEIDVEEFKSTLDGVSEQLRVDPSLPVSIPAFPLS